MAKHEPYESPWKIVRVLLKTLDQFREANPNLECAYCGNLFFCTPTQMLGQFGDGEIFPEHSFRCRVCKRLVGFDPQTGRTWQAKVDEVPEGEHEPPRVWLCEAGKEPVELKPPPPECTCCVDSDCECCIKCPVHGIEP